MMHLFTISAAVSLAWLLRLGNLSSGNYDRRWQHALLQFLLSPILLMATAVAIVCMGPHGQMVWRWEGWLCYLLALGFLGFTGIMGWQLTAEVRRSLRQVRTYPRQEVFGTSSRLLETPLVFSAQIGLWQPELIVSQGLLDTLDGEHLQAVLAHENAHLYYRDTFWFFGLGWLRRCSPWLPNTEALWQELLLLREIRADRQAAQYVDPLLLAESLLFVARAPLQHSESFCAAFSCAAPRSRIEERIDALLVDSLIPPKTNVWALAWLFVAFVPLFVIPFHY
jgi:Zn-dependent protease with chaperone function